MLGQVSLSSPKLSNKEPAIKRECCLPVAAGESLELTLGRAVLERKSGEHLRAGFEFSTSFSRPSLGMVTPRVTPSDVALQEPTHCNAQWGRLLT